MATMRERGGTWMESIPAVCLNRPVAISMLKIIGSIEDQTRIKNTKAEGPFEPPAFVVLLSPPRREELLSPRCALYSQFTRSAGRM